MNTLPPGPLGICIDTIGDQQSRAARNVVAAIRRRAPGVLIGGEPWPQRGPIRFDFAVTCQQSLGNVPNRPPVTGPNMLWYNTPNRELSVPELEEMLERMRAGFCCVVQSQQVPDEEDPTWRKVVGTAKTLGTPEKPRLLFGLSITALISGHWSDFDDVPLYHGDLQDWQHIAALCIRETARIGAQGAYISITPPAVARDPSDDWRIAMEWRERACIAGHALGDKLGIIAGVLQLHLHNLAWWLYVGCPDERHDGLTERPYTDGVVDFNFGPFLALTPATPPPPPATAPAPSVPA